VSSALGGTAVAVTRYLVHGADPVTLAVLRWGIGFLCVLPIALMLRVCWPQPANWAGITFRLAKSCWSRTRTAKATSPTTSKTRYRHSLFFPIE
jgi:hypothetical protein